MSVPQEAVTRLEALIRSKRVVINVWGCGYIGASLCRLIYDHDFTNIRGIDPSASALKTVAEWCIDTYHPELAEPADINIVAVPTAHVAAVIAQIYELQPVTSLILVESTVDPSAVDLFDEEDLWVLSPERIDPGSRHDITDIPKLIGAGSPGSERLAKLFYIALGLLTNCGTPTEVSLAKLIENTYRAVNIALADEFRGICEMHKVNVDSVLQLAATKPFGFSKFVPTLGPGGCCIQQSAQLLLAHHPDIFAASAILIRDAIRINQDRPRHVAFCCAGSGQSIGIIGATYKPDYPSMAGSKTLEVMQELERFSRRIHCWDPLWEQLEQREGRIPHFCFLPELLAQSDVILLAVNHTGLADILLEHEAELRDVIVLDACGMLNSTHLKHRRV